LELGMSGVAVG